MTTVAMRFDLVRAGDSTAAQDVFSARNSVKMIRSHATPVSAEMVDRHAIWNLAVVQFIAKSMCQLLAKRARTLRHMENAITARRSPGGPFPAIARTVNETPEARERVESGTRHQIMAPAHYTSQ
jgi:hypothetical protein